jgi:hypothetical protein
MKQYLNGREIEIICWFQWEVTVKFLDTGEIQTIDSRYNKIKNS